MAKEKKLYTYNGGVLSFGKIVTNNYKAQTYAVSEKQAANNILFQFKLKMGYNAGSAFSLAGKVVQAGA